MPTDLPTDSPTDLPSSRPPDDRPLTLEWLVALDIGSFRSRRDAARVRAASTGPATMDAQASTRPSPASLRKNGTAPRVGNDTRTGAQ